jgi:hypothetical protein
MLIKIPEKEYKPILDREENIDTVRKYFINEIKLLTNMVNYGSNLIPRCLSSSSKKIEDIIILNVLFRQALSMLDAIEILISNAAIYPANLQLRVAWEARLFIEWILKDETREKSKFYYVSHLRKNRIWALRVQSGSEENKKFIKSMGNYGNIFFQKRSNIEKEGQKSIEDINNFLSKNDYKYINEEFDNYIKKNKSRYEPKWYNPLGITSIKKMAEKLKCLPEYEVYYSSISEIVHSTKFEIKFVESRVFFEPIRYLKGIDIILMTTVTMLIKIFKQLLNHYRPNERFSEKYVEEWRNTFLNIKYVEYDYDIQNFVEIK